MSGERRGPGASVLRGLLRLAALAYALVLAIRRALYRLGLKRPAPAPRPVLSVGNIVAGGTGKTPMVEDLARRLLARGRRPAILSRGYGAERTGAPNDEALMLQRALPEVPHVIDADRVRGAETAASRHGADCLILDDGFQHWRIARDLDLVLIDALAPFGPAPERASPAGRPHRGYLLPRGLRREPLSALGRAHAIALTRADLCPPERLAAIRSEVERLRPGGPIIEVAFEAVSLRRVGAADGQVLARGPAWLEGRRVFAFCGIGNPSGFFRGLERLGARIAGRRPFGDHHRYEPEEIAALRREAEAAGAEALVTTEKDAAKIGAIEGAGPILVLGIRAAIRAGEADLERLIDRALAAAAAKPRSEASGRSTALAEATA